MFAEEWPVTVLAPSHTLIQAYPPKSHTARHSVYTDKSYKSIWIPQQSCSNLFVWNLWWICNFQQTQRRPYPYLFVHVKGWVISQHNWLAASGGVCVCLCVCECCSLSRSMSEWRLVVRQSVPLRHLIRLCHCLYSLCTYTYTTHTDELTSTQWNDQMMLPVL